MRTLLFFTISLLLTCLSGCTTVSYGSCNYCWNSSVWITLFICITIIVIALIIKCAVTSWKKGSAQNTVNESASQYQPTKEEKQREEEDKEKKVYRERLVNFLEKQAIKSEQKVKTYGNGKETETKTVEYDSNIATEYINELKKLAIDLIPTDYKEQTEPTNPNNPTEQTDYSRGSEADD